MKSKFLISTLALSMASLLTLSTAYAEQQSEYDSEAKINFTQPTDSPVILDPETIEPMEEQPEGTGQTGPLTLDYVSNIDFGSHEVSPSEQTYESTTDRPFIQITDRRGTGEGWSLTAKASSFESNGVATLPGSKISFSNGEAQSPSTTSAPEVNQEIELVTGGEATNVVTAKSKGNDGAVRDAQGLGSWVVKWLKDDENRETNQKVTLNVPEAAASSGEHTSEITWTLYDGPGQE